MSGSSTSSAAGARRVCTTGGILAVKFVVTYFVLHALFGNEIPLRPMTVAAAGGAGFAIGALCAGAWLYRSRH